MTVYLTLLQGTCQQVMYQLSNKQAGAELGQAQVKLDAIIEVIVEVIKLSSTIILLKFS